MPANVGPSDAARYGWPGIPEPVLVADATRIARHIARAHPPVVALFPVDGRQTQGGRLAPALLRLAEALLNFAEGNVAIIDTWRTWPWGEAAEWETDSRPPRPVAPPACPRNRPCALRRRLGRHGGAGERAGGPAGGPDDDADQPRRIRRRGGGTVGAAAGGRGGAGRDHPAYTAADADVHRRPHSGRQAPGRDPDRLSPPMALSNPLSAALARARGKNLHNWTAGYARWLARSTAARARAAFTRGGGPRHLLFAFCDHYEPHWKNTDVAVGRRARARLARTATRRWPTVPRRRRAAAAPLLLLPRRGVRSPAISTRSPTSRARARRGRAAPPPRRRHAPTTLRATIADYLRLFAEPRPPVARLRTAGCATRSSTATGASPTRAATGAGAASTTSCRCFRDRLLRRLHVPGGARRVAAADRQPDLLARRRSRAAPRLRAGVPARVGEVARDRILMIEGPLALALRPGRLLAPRIENAARHGRRSRRRRRASAAGCARASTSRAGPSGCSSRCTPTARPRSRRPSMLGEGRPRCCTPS